MKLGIKFIYTFVRSTDDFLDELTLDDLFFFLFDAPKLSSLSSSEYESK